MKVARTCRPRQPGRRLRNLVPFDRSHVLELISADLSVSRLSLSGAYPWMSVTTKRVAPLGAGFQVEDGSVDCIYADHVLERLVNTSEAIARAFQVLCTGGVLVAAIRTDGRNARRGEPRHLWKATAHDISARLAEAGFVDLELTDRARYRLPGWLPYPPWCDRTAYVRAWKRPAPNRHLDRLDELCRWTYGTLQPDQPAVSNDATVIISQRSGWCLDYVIVLGRALQREGIDVRWVTMVAEGHPRGRGPEKAESHEALEATLPNGHRYVVDPMANVRFPGSVADVLRHPELADVNRVPDERYRSRGYDLYATSVWYSRVTKIDVRLSPRDPLRLLPVARVTRPTLWSDFIWAPRRRPFRHLAYGVLARGRRALARETEPETLVPR